MAGFLISINTSHRLSDKSDYFKSFQTFDINSTALQNESLAFSNHEEARLVAQVACGLLTVTGFLENLLALCVLCTIQGFQGPPDILILNLVISDLVRCMVYQPILTVYYFLGWIYGGHFCQVFAYLQNAHVGVGLCAITAIVLQHYCAIVHPRWNKHFFSSRSWLLTVIILTWSYMGIILFLPLFTIWGKFDYERYVFMCSLKLDASPMFNWFAAATCVMLPCSLIVVSLIHTAIYVHRRTAVITINDITVDIPIMKNNICYVHLTKIITVVFLSFVLCYVPYVVYLVMVPYEEEYPLMLVIAIIPGWATSTLNPLIYFIMNGRYLRGCSNMCCSSSCCYRPNIKVKRISTQEVTYPAEHILETDII